MCLPTIKPGVPRILSESASARLVLSACTISGAAHVLLQPIDIKPYRTRHLIDRFVGDLTFGCHHCVVKGLVFALPLGCERGMRGDDRCRSEDRHFLVEKTQLRVLFQQCLQRRQHLLAVGTTVIEELDDCHIAPRITSYRRRRVIENFAPVVAQNCPALASASRFSLSSAPCSASIKTSGLWIRSSWMIPSIACRCSSCHFGSCAGNA